MRITSNMIAAQQMTGIQSNLALLEQAQQRVTTGKSFNAPSENPTAAVKVMSAGSSLRALEQYRTNVQRASSRISVEDATLQQLGDLVSRAQDASEWPQGHRHRQRPDARRRERGSAGDLQTDRRIGEYQIRQ